MFSHGTEMLHERFPTYLEANVAELRLHSTGADGSNTYVCAHKVVPAALRECCYEGFGAAVDAAAAIMICGCYAADVDDVPLHVRHVSQSCPMCMAGARPHAL